MAIEASSVQETFRLMQAKLSKLVPDVELRVKAELVYEINRLKKERGAIILGHNYMEASLYHTVADVVGDSLELSRKAAETDCDPIVFCGVRFMAETAKILNPGKTVLVPDMDAGCSLADRCPADVYSRWLEQFPGATVVNYINSSAAVKAMSDLVVTSSNAVDLVAQLPVDSRIVFGPDRHLGRWVMRRTGREMDLWPGFCIVHEQFNRRRLERLRLAHPDAEVIAHPECEESVLETAAFVGSTKALLDHVVRSTDRRKFLVATEMGILHRMQAARPDAEFICSPPNSGCDCAVCPYMRLNTLGKVYLCLRDGEPELTMDEEPRSRAERPLIRMLEMSRPR